MNSTLLIRLQGPMQAWGANSRFSIRETTREPTKSGVVGLLCAALGRERTEPIDDLAQIRMGVRADQEGTLMADFHTARSVLNAEGKILRNAVLSNRYYLSDAVFLVGLETSDFALLENLDAALRCPRWLLFLGRKSFPLSKPAWLLKGLQRDKDLETALQNYPWLIDRPERDWQRKKLPDQLRYIYECTGASIQRQDWPVSFEKRTFKERHVEMQFEPPPDQFLEEVEGA